MTSAERHEARYQRRKVAREAKKRAYIDPYDDFSRIYNRNALSRATHDSALGVGWKMSVKRLRHNKLIVINRQAERLQNGLSVHRGFISFAICERGKPRDIMSVRFSERIVQKSECSNVLYPVLSRRFIYDNCANIRGKGTHFARRRVVTHLNRYYRKNKTNVGYVLIIDFKSFFNNIAHNPLKALLREIFLDPDLIHFLERQIDDYADYFGRPVGLGLGGEPNQLYASLLPDPLDHYIKEKLRIHGYIRFMDDLILIHEDKEYLKKCLIEIRVICLKYGIVLNNKKTNISRIDKGFTYLKTHYRLTETGHVVKRPSRDSITRQRRRLKKFKRLLDNGDLTFEEVRKSYASWRGSLLDRDSYRTLINMDKLFDKLFIEEWR